jgi:transcriptional regulator with XRE-family HTH domain
MYHICIMDISKTIRTVREEKRLTQLEVAEKLQMERSNYARLEARGNKLSVEQLEQIAVALGVSVVELITGEAKKVEDRGRLKELEKRVDELEKTINLYEILQETSKNQIHLLADILLKCFLYLIYTEEILKPIEDYLKDPKSDIEFDLDTFHKAMLEGKRLSNEQIESIILRSQLTGLMMFDTNFMLKLLSTGENSRNVFSKKIHEHFGNQYQRYLKILAMQPDDILTLIEKSKEYED